MQATECLDSTVIQTLPELQRAISMGNKYENFFLKLPHPLRTVAATYQSWQLDRKRRGGNYHHLVKQYDFSMYFHKTWEEYREYQLERVSQLLQHAWEYVPYYREILPERPVLKDLSQLQDIPCITKHHAREAGQRLLDQRRKDKPHYVGHTSGSTGSPFAFHLSYDALRVRFAMRDNFYRFHGVDFDRERNIRIGGRLFMDVKQDHPPFWLFDRVTNQLMFSIYHMSDTTMSTFVEPIRHFKPTFVTGYPSGIYMLAHFCKRKGIEFRPKVVFTDSETVLDYQRELIEEVWQCPVRDYLGMEAGWIAGQCQFGKYHLSPLTGVVEILDDWGNPQPPGKIGEIVVTDLVNDLMPLIRYRTGDTAEWSSEDCDCGWNTPTLKRIEGRIDDTVVLPNGRKVGRLDHIFKNASHIKECQIVQDKRNHFIFRLVPDAGYNERIENSILQEARLRLGEDVSIDIQIVNEIERTSRGKFKSVISRVGD